MIITNRSNRFALILFLAGIMLPCSPVFQQKTIASASEVIVTDRPMSANTPDLSIRIPATFHPQRFNRAAGLKNHHFITWKEGNAAGRALFTTTVADSTVHDALLGIGARPGNNLTEKSWTARKNRRSPFPDMLIEGTVVQIDFLIDGDTIGAHDILRDDAGNAFDFRFGGNRDLISVWQSGCVVCLQSCPGSKIGNRTYSIRDLVKGHSQFSVKKDSRLEDGDTLEIRFSIIAEQH